MKVNLNSRTDICTPLGLLFRKLNDCSAIFPTTDDIENFSSQIQIIIKKVNVAESSNGVLQFDPCFFLPHPENFLQEYPIDYEGYRRYGDDLEDIERFGKLEDFCQSRLDSSDELDSTDWIDHLHEAELVHRCLDSHLHVARCPKGDCPPGYDDGFYFHEFRRLEYTKLDELRGRYVMSRLPYTGPPPTNPSWWKSYKIGPWRYRDKTDPLPPRPPQRPESFGYHKEDAPWPHTIGTCSSGVEVSDVESGLTRHELKAIMEIMVWRIMHKNYGIWNVYPILILSVMGPQQGRIIQASYDGWLLNLQYSQLWPLRSEKAAAFELFFRYLIAQPIRDGTVSIDPDRIKRRNTNSKA